MPNFSLGDIRPQFPESGRYWVAPTATLIGDVHLEDEASVWFQAVLRGDREPIKIGRRSNVQDGCVFHTDPGMPLTVGANCTIGHNVILHGCTIRDNSLIGMGSTILNGAVIGSNCIIGANALVAEGKVIPDNSLVVGVPGKVARVLPDSIAGDILKSADNYVANWQRYAEGLNQV
ncbi:gamma carbonic anhydrase family protein [Labrenzia sp. PHM005]|uniref:gamma carbonic anhydrase family protein n=1 Tax=Labrenzia sp. PHM005 TaxID=2590016 RepID=UPI0011403897|nr:gamma carbonic anhydrase family protein [Labrenzia sp. PHM005]QDG77031.1 gamma carbonic anhydrase family protein [Labrenzia sp. PHM005]